MFAGKPAPGHPCTVWSVLRPTVLIICVTSCKTLHALEALTAGDASAAVTAARVFTTACFQGSLLPATPALCRKCCGLQCLMYARHCMRVKLQPPVLLLLLLLLLLLPGCSLRHVPRGACSWPPPHCLERTTAPQLAPYQQAGAPCAV
jgi:hypothetical protein